MTDKSFFEIYIAALEKALSIENLNTDGDVLTPDWFIEDENKRKEVYVFEELTYDRYKSLFEKVSFYFDAKYHGFDKVQNISIERYKTLLEDEILLYKHNFKIDNKTPRDNID